MNIELHEILIKDLVENYVNSDEEGVIGYNGKLNIRPPYQREFVYKPEQRDKVIDTVMKNFPLNVMYWVKSGDNSFELMDGQQRTISICEYFKCNFPVNFRYFFNLTDTEKEEFLNYKLMVYICEGNDKEKLDDKSIDNIGFWKRKAGIFREKAGFIGNIMQRACTISDKFKGF